MSDRVPSTAAMILETELDITRIKNDHEMRRIELEHIIKALFRSGRQLDEIKKEIGKIDELMKREKDDYERNLAAFTKLLSELKADAYEEGRKAAARKAAARKAAEAAAAEAAAAEAAAAEAAAAEAAAHEAAHGTPCSNGEPPSDFGWPRFS